MELCDKVTGRTHRRFWKCLETLPAHLLVGIGSGPQGKARSLYNRAAELSAGRSLHWRGARIFHHGQPNRHSRLGRPLLSWLALAVSRAAAPLRPARSEEGELHPQWGHWLQR